MNKILEEILKNEKGGIQSIIISFLLAIIGLSGILGISTWFEDQNEKLEQRTIAQIDKLFEENAPAAGIEFTINDVEVKEVEVEEIEVNEVNLKIED